MTVSRSSALRWMFLAYALLEFISGQLSSASPSAISGAGYEDTCESPALRRHRENKIRIGVILPFQGNYVYRIQLTRPAVEHARDYIYKRTDLLRNYTIEFDYRDSKCSEINGPLEAIDMYIKKSADLFLGPACDYAIAVVARFTRAWEIPIISAGALVAAFSNKDVYGLLTRVMGSFDKLAEFFVSLLTNFRYTQIGMLLYTNKNDTIQGKSECWFIMEPIFLLIVKKLNPQLDMKYVETFHDDTNTPEDFEKNLKYLSKKCRGETSLSFSPLQLP